MDVYTKVLIALSFYATGSYQTLVGDSIYHPVAQSSVSKAVSQVTAALNHPLILNKYIRFPCNRHDRETVKRRFNEVFHIPGAVGCIDGTHIAMVTPAHNEERFFNRKGYHSLNVLIICDADMKILNVDPSYPGACHDNTVWAGNQIKPLIEQWYEEDQENIFLLGDSGYPLRETLMVPILDAEPDSPEAYYTELHLSARCVVERCIGVLKGRFRCLLVDRKLHYTPQKAALITNACCVLHNIAHPAQIEYTPLTEEERRRERELTIGASLRAAAAAGPAARNRAAQQLQLEAGRRRQAALVRQVWALRST